ncbi:MAG: HD domain-containing protein [Clostridiales bacterium]|nr:HD domain-containing protein [Clostridiales bacterium]
MSKRNVFLCILALLLAMLLPAASLASSALNETQYVVTVYNDRNGLPTGEANVVYQTSDSYVWIGSYGGLIRYDGTNFRNFSQEGKIESSSIRALMEDAQGRLWIGTNDAGVYLYDGEQFIRIVQEQGNPFLSIRDFAQGKDGTIYVASSAGLGEIRDGVLVPIDDPQLSGETIYTLGVDRYGRIWASLNDWKCAVVKDGAVVGIVLSESVFPKGEQIYAVASDASGVIYLGTYQNKVAKVTFTGEALDASGFTVQIMDTGNVTIHNRLRITRQGDVLVSGQMGFAWITLDGTLRQFGEESHVAALNSAIRDYEGNFWLASSSYGVIKFSKGCYVSPNAVAGLDNIAVNTIAFQAGCYYLGLDSGLMVFDENWQPVHNELTEMLAGVRIRQIVASNDGSVWLGTYSANGVICYEPATGAMVAYNEENGMTNSWSRTLLELQDGTVAAGTNSGFYLLKDGSVQAFYGTEHGMNNAAILCFTQTDDGTLYIGTDGGGMYTLSNGTLTGYGEAEGLTEGVVLRLLPDGDGGMFVSAGSSLYYWQDGHARKLDNFDKAAGSIFDFYLKDEQLWVLQNSGVLQVDKARLLAGEDADTTQYGFSYGLTGSLNANTWNYLSSDGRLYLATRNGVSIFAFEGIISSLPNGIINDVWVDGDVYEHPTKLTLTSDTRRITIDFSMLSFTDTSQSHIAYCLEGIDSEETIVDGKKNDSISYTNLPGGDYTFRMRVFNPEHPAQGRTYKVEIHKEKRLMEQPWFWVLIGLCTVAVITALIYLINRAHMNNLRRRKEEYQAILDQSLKTFARVIDAKDPYTNGHSIRVAEYARELARRMDMSEEEQERIYFVAMLHDIGKIGIPDNILNKESSLTPEERKIIQTHPDVGGRVLKDFTSLEGISEGARYHHERYDGDGYCEGKKGEEIPLVARIIGVADSYDAMSSDRCYRDALCTEDIIRELKEGSGTQFDPQVIPHMLKMIEDGIGPATLADKSQNDAKMA